MEVTNGRVALVTGSSRGLGAVIAQRLARDGFAVAVNGRPGDEQVAAVGRAICDDGGTAAGFCADVTDERQAAGLAAAVTDSLGPVDVLVLNATGPQPEAAATEVTWADHTAQLDFFVKSPVLLGRAILPGMQARRYGRVVQVDSEVARRADGNSRRHRPRRQFPRLRGRGIHHRPAHPRRRWAQPRQLNAGAGARPGSAARDAEIQIRALDLFMPRAGAAWEWRDGWGRMSVSGPW